MRYFIDNAMSVGLTIGLIAFLLLTFAFLVGSIVHDFRQRIFGLAFMELYIFIIGCMVTIRYLCRVL